PDQPAHVVVGERCLVVQLICSTGLVTELVVGNGGDGSVREGGPYGPVESVIVEVGDEVLGSATGRGTCDRLGDPVPIGVVGVRVILAQGIGVAGQMARGIVCIRRHIAGGIGHRCPQAVSVVRICRGVP